MQIHQKIYVAGHTGLVGRAIVRKLNEEGYDNLVLKTRAELDLRNQAAVQKFFQEEKPDYVFLAAAKVGGIMANAIFPTDFIYDNTIIAANVINACYVFGVKKLMNLGSSCIYPKYAAQPLTEDALLTGALEPTNEAYAIAKIAAIKMCSAYNKQHNTNFLSVMPTNLYGPYDNFNLDSSHVLPALIKKFYDAKINNTPFVELWGNGSAKREFLYVDDLAACVILLMQQKNAVDLGEFVNVGTGIDITIEGLAQLVKSIVGYQGTIKWDTSKPNGTPQKLLDLRKIHSLGWHHTTELSRGIRETYEWFKSYEIIKGLPHH